MKCQSTQLSFRLWSVLFALPWMSGCAAEAERELESASHTEFLCPAGPAFPSCYGNCVGLACSPIDPGACCHCDDGCLARGDCCCDYVNYCVSTPPPPASCEGYCDGQSPAGCWCDTACTGMGDCCDDYVDMCVPPPSCEGHCGGQSPAGCWCDELCSSYGDCCGDYTAACESACNGSAPTPGMESRIAAIAVGPTGELYAVGNRVDVATPMDARDGFLRRLHPTTLATLWEVPVDNCYWDSIQDVTVTPSGDAVVVGSMRSGPFGSTPATFFVRRYGSSGELQWHYAPDAASGESTGSAVTVDPTNGSLVVTGWVTGPPFAPLFARVLADGTPSLIRSLDLTVGAHGGVAVSIDGTGHVAVLASVPQPGSTETLVGRLDSGGNVLWSQNQAFPSAVHNTPVDVATDASGNVYALSEARSSGGTRQPFLVRYGSSGSVMWTRTVAPGTGMLIPTALMRHPSGTLVMAGHGRPDATPVLRPWLSRVSATGTLLDHRVLESPTVFQVPAAALQAGGSAAYLVIEQTGSSSVMAAPL